MTDNRQPLNEIQRMLVEECDSDHFDDAAILAQRCEDFAVIMFAKMLKARKRKGFTNDFIDDVGNADDLRLQLYGHILKGDPVDVANYCLFLHGLNEPTATPETNPYSVVKNRIRKAVEDIFVAAAENPPIRKTGRNAPSEGIADIPPRFRDPELQMELPLSSGANPE